MYAAKVVADSIAFGTRLTTFELVFPRFILAEFNTHRMFSRNSASSRAIPVPRRIEQIEANPFVPEAFAKNKSGMQAGEALSVKAQDAARRAWVCAARAACGWAQELADVNVHKQWANRLIETFAWHTVVVTSTEWDNFFALRTSPAAQPEIQVITKLMKQAYAASTPVELVPGAWHLPYTTQHDYMASDSVVGPFEIDDISNGDAEYKRYTDTLLKVSVARCAAVSFERQDAEKTVEQLVARHDGLKSAGHMSPFEHQAQVVEPKGEFAFNDDYFLDAYDPPFGPVWRARDLGEVGPGPAAYVLDGYFCGNFRAPFLQYRKTLPGERVYRGE